MIIIHGVDDSRLLPRSLQTTLDLALRSFPVVVVTGSRQTGKSTLVSSLVDFRRLLRAACLRLGNLIDQTELGRDVGMPQPTMHRHLGLLEASYQLVRIPAYAVNRTKRLIKTPKAYWCDTALALHLAAETEPRGAHLENIVLSDLLSWRETQIPRSEIFYWRTTAGTPWRKLLWSTSCASLSHVFLGEVKHGAVDLAG
jgi:predicted AAA+ superfamily ATPase